VPYIYNALLEHENAEWTVRVTRPMPVRVGETLTVKGETWVVIKVDTDTGPDLDGFLYCRPAG
jgi:hypothetical protein